MKESNKGLGLYDNLDLSASQNDQDLLEVYRKWASIYDQDNDDVLGTVSQPNSVQIFHKHLHKFYLPAVSGYIFTQSRITCDHEKYFFNNNPIAPCFRCGGKKMRNFCVFSGNLNF